MRSKQLRHKQINLLGFIRTKNLTDNNYMAKPLTKSQLAATVADASGVTKKTATEILDLLAQLSYKLSLIHI